MKKAFAMIIFILLSLNNISCKSEVGNSSNIQNEICTCNNIDIVEKASKVHISEYSKYTYGEGSKDSKTVSVSIINLIATPDKYDGVRVRITGFVTFGFEDNAIYLTKEGLDCFDYRNALLLTFKSEQYEIFETYDALYGKFVYFEGIFNQNKGDIVYLFSGEITDINYFCYAGTRSERFNFND